MLIKLNCLKGIELKIRSYETSVKVSIQLGSSKTILRIEKTSERFRKKLISCN